MCDARNTLEGNCRDARKGTCKYYLWDGRCMKLIKNDDPITLDLFHEDEEREFDDGQVTRRFEKEWPELSELLEGKEHERKNAESSKGRGEEVLGQG